MSSTPVRWHEPVVIRRAWLRRVSAVTKGKVITWAADGYAEPRATTADSISMTLRKVIGPAHPSRAPGPAPRRRWAAFDRALGRDPAAFEPIALGDLGHPLAARLRDVLADLDGVTRGFDLPDLLLGRKREQRSSSFSGRLDVGPVADIEVEPTEQLGDRLGRDRDLDRKLVRRNASFAVRSTGVLWTWHVGHRIPPSWRTSPGPRPRSAQPRSSSGSGLISIVF